MMYDAVEQGVGQGGIVDQLVPGGWGGIGW